MEVEPIKGTVNAARAVGYSPQQAEIVGCVDRLFESAVRLGLVSDKDAVEMGQDMGRRSGRFTGKPVQDGPLVPTEAEMKALDQMFNPEVTCWDELEDHLKEADYDTLWMFYKKVRTWVERNIK